MCVAVEPVLNKDRVDTGFLVRVCGYQTGIHIREITVIGTQDRPDLVEPQFHRMVFIEEVLAGLQEADLAGEFIPVLCDGNLLAICLECDLCGIVKDIPANIFLALAPGVIMTVRIVDVPEGG